MAGREGISPGEFVQVVKHPPKNRNIAIVALVPITCFTLVMFSAAFFLGGEHKARELQWHIKKKQQFLLAKREGRLDPKTPYGPWIKHQRALLRQKAKAA